ncbi:SDR family NAD(P)-dependent oxidoreductase [Robertmurraya sp. DFI.2.37]|uniref:SDR family NAD(P)-dependent oxidoreductase n=1 Tax=Robertmurraya sp. DFI.2.37 TaxID=3031819 RepID=UPI001247BF02|nr:SDR family NAD(P)-dependent oxidoreductase [Robertmurraya sp. DFI.2.37]MDF1507511.1 SDR family NAD(P)-dependent oxidoreductase [Robertmurraya sp. DFI.2.37]
MSEDKHVLVTGGTGMLKGVVRYFVEQGNTVSVVARNKEKLQSLSSTFRNLPGTVHPIAIDYTQTDDFIRRISQSISHFGPFFVSVNWIHSTAPHTPAALLQLQAHTSPGSRYMQLYGSAFANPERKDDDRNTYRKECPQIHYQEIILGFMIEGSSSRWLTNREICEGVINALASSPERKIIGAVSPWSLRP